jgi:hypothetical protein
MDVLEMFPVVPNRIRLSGSCAKLLLDAEIECGAFISATNQLFGEGAARTAGDLWVEELEAGPNHFRGHDSDWRIVTISAANRLANLMDRGQMLGALMRTMCSLTSRQCEHKK